MADRWLIYVAAAFGLAVVTMLALAGVFLVGLFLAGLIVVAAVSAVAPKERAATADELRRACNHLPFCDCG